MVWTRAGPTVHFLKNGTVLAVNANVGSSYALNNRERGPQHVVVSVPESVAPGEWRIVVDVSGKRSHPFPVVIGEPTAPRLDRLWPATVNPGGSVTIWGAHFRPTDAHEVVDASGRVVGSSGSGTSGDTFGLGVPDDVVAGEMTVRVRARTTDGELVSNSLPLVVTSDPLPVEIWPELSLSVGPGQWASLSAILEGPLQRSHRTEVEFQQNGRSIVVATVRPDSTRVRIPLWRQVLSTCARARRAGSRCHHGPTLGSIKSLRVRCRRHRVDRRGPYATIGESHRGAGQAGTVRGRRGRRAALAWSLAR